MTPPETPGVPSVPEGMPGNIPEWATVVSTVTDRRADRIEYAVYLHDEEGITGRDYGDGMGGSGGRSWLVWSLDVFFDVTAAHGSGGIAFRNAAHAQETLAEEYAAILFERTTTAKVPA
jgi:hypothetical protein